MKWKFPEKNQTKKKIGQYVWPNNVKTYSSSKGSIYLHNKMIENKTTSGKKGKNGTPGWTRYSVYGASFHKTPAQGGGGKGVRGVKQRGKDFDIGPTPQHRRRQRRAAMKIKQLKTPRGGAEFQKTETQPALICQGPM